MWDASDRESEGVCLSHGQASLRPCYPCGEYAEGRSPFAEGSPNSFFYTPKIGGSKGVEKAFSDSLPEGWKRVLR